MREMKYSGVEWIEDIPASWNMIRFKDKYKSTKEIAGESSTEYERLALTLGGVIKRPKDDSEGLQPKAFDGYQILRENDFIFKMIDLQNISTSRVGLSPYTGLVSPAYIRFQAKNKNQFNKYVYYYLMSMYYNCVFNSLGGNGVRSALNASDMGTLMIPFPPENEQMLVVETIEHQTEKVDSLIANQQTQIEKLKAYKQSLITEVVTKGLDPTAPMKDSGVEWIGEIPASWQVGRIKNILSESGERTKSGKEEPLSMSQKCGLIPTKQMDIVPNIASSFGNCKIVHTGDLVFNKLKAHLGVFATSDYNGLVSPDYAVYQPKPNVDVKYFELLFKTPQYVGQFIKNSRGIAQGLTRLYTGDLFSIYVAIPPYEKQREISSVITMRFAKIDRLIAIKQTKIEKLEQYKKSLIYEYVTGKKEAM